MSKKKFDGDKPELGFTPFVSPIEEFKTGTLIDAINELIPGAVPDDEKLLMSRMYDAAIVGVTPERYSNFYRLFRAAEKIAGIDREESDDDVFFSMIEEVREKNVMNKRYDRLADDSEITLLMKITMKDVKKPPMWREVEIPASFNFLLLHEVIQTVTGLEDSHLWRFGLSAYGDDRLCIGEPFDDDYTDYTHLAEETPLTVFFQQKGDKLEYVYDYGDDWIFTLEVKKVIRKKSDHPQCVNYKSELNALEDSGGPFAYERLRYVLTEWDSFSAKERKDLAEDAGFSTPNKFYKYLASHIFDLTEVNSQLAEMC